MLDEPLLFCCVKVQAEFFPIIGIGLGKIIFPDILPHEKTIGQGILYLVLHIVLMDAPLMRPVCSEWEKGWGAGANLVNGGNLGTRTLGSEIQDSPNIVRKKG